MYRPLLLWGVAILAAFGGDASLGRLTPADRAGLEAAFQRAQQAMHAVEGGHRARNLGQDWHLTFDGRGFAVAPRDGGWSWGLALESYGFPGAERTAKGARATAAQDRLTYRWDAGLEEWFINGSGGLEHGYTVAARPAGARAGEPLAFQLAVRGALEPRVTGNGRDVSFVDRNGAAVLHYAGLKVTDATGRELPAKFRATGHALRLEVDESGARYPVTVDPVATQAYLKPALIGSTQVGDQMGKAVAIDGETAVIGSPFESSSTAGVNSTPNESAVGSGAVYVFVRSGSTWTQQAYIKATNTGTGALEDWFGIAVSISGNTLVVGAPNEDSSTTGINSTANESAPDSGAAYIFTRTGTTWSQQAYLKPGAVGTSQNGDLFGLSVSISGDTVAVGAPYESSSSGTTPNESAVNSGAVYIFTRSGSTWSQQAYVKRGATGSDVAGDEFGYSLSLSGDTLLVGSPREGSSSTGINSTGNNGATNAGAAYVFVRSGTTWTQQAYLKPAAVGAGQSGDAFGWSVAINGDTAVVGAPFEASSTTGINSIPNESAPAAGAAYVFQRSGTTWSQQAYLKPAAVGVTQMNDAFGWSVSVSGSTVVVGAPFEASSTVGVNTTPNDSAQNSGAAYVFSRSGSNWTQSYYLKRTNAAGSAIGALGWAVAVNATTVVVGAPWDYNSKTGINTTPDANAPDSGAAYIHSLGGPMNVTQTGPLAGTGATQTLVFKYTHTGGFGQLGVVNALINSYLDGNAACYVAFSQPLNVLYLVNDGGPGSGISAGLTLGGGGSVSNNQCTISAAGSSATRSGDTLTLTLNVTFKPAFYGNKVIYLAAQDQGAETTGWVTVGSTIVPETVPPLPRSGTMTPSTGTASSEVISFTYTDASSTNNLQTAWALINFAIDGRAACYVAYYRPGNQIYLYPDNGDGNQATSIVLTGTNTIENSQCRISAQGSSVVMNGATMTVNLNYTFKPAFSGFKAIWTAVATTNSAQVSAWKPVGGWLVP
jgi:hypothetical protein